MTDSTCPDPLDLLREVGLVPEIGSRALFPKLEARAYLAHAAIAPAHRANELSAERFMSAAARLGVGAFPVYAAQRERLRARLARLLGANVSDVGLTPGTTRGIGDIALALPLSGKDEIVTFVGEFPANVVPFQLAASGVLARVTLLDAPDPARGAVPVLEAVRERLCAGARYVAVSAVQFQTGLTMPLHALGELCSEFDAHLLVDAIQAVGAMPIDVGRTPVSALMGGAHKWLLGLEGTGYAYVSPRLAAELQPKTAGWLSSDDSEKFLFEGAGHLRYDRPLKLGASVFEGGTLSALGYTTLEAGVAVVEHVGPRAIFEHIQRYHDALEPGLVALGFESLRAGEQPGRSGNLSFRLPSGVSLPVLGRELRARGVVPSTPDGLLRFAPHYANSLEEVPFVIEAVGQALRAAKSSP